MNFRKYVACGLTAVMLASSASAATQDNYTFRAGNTGVIKYVGGNTPEPPETPPEEPVAPFTIFASSADTISTPIGVANTVAFSTQGGKGAVSYALVSAPADLAAQIDATTGVLSFKPTKAGAFAALVRATDAATSRTADKQLQITVSAVAEPNILDVAEQLALGTVGDTASFTPTVLNDLNSTNWTEDGTVFSISADLSPYGITFDTTTGKIGGVITAHAYLKDVVISVTSKRGHTDSTTPFTLILTPAEDMVFAESVTGIVKTTPATPTTKALTVLNALGPVTYSITQKSNGLTATIDNQNKSYTLSAAGGDYTMTVHAVDAVGRSADKDLTVNVGTFYDLDFMAIAKYNACGLSLGGGLYCWGTNNPASKTKVPAAVAGFESGVTTVAVGISNVCVIKNGALYCVGGNAFGQIGDNTQVDKTAFTAVSGMGSGVTDVAVVGEVTGTGSDTFHVCAVKNGQAYCWGSNTAKQIANSSTTLYKTPTLVSGLPVGVTKVGVGATAGSAFSCAIASGQVYCWGSNGSGQLGVGDNTDKATPTLVAGLGSTVTDLDTSMLFACAVSGGKAYCWGNNSSGQLGIGNKTGKNVPTLVSLAPASRIDVGQYAACANTGSTWSCWGDGVTSPTVVQVPYVLRYVSVGYQNTCALSNDGGYCWGSNRDYVFGDGTTVGSATPKSIPYY